MKIALIHRVTLVGRLRLPGHSEPMTELNHLLGWWQQDPERFLDFIHYYLQEIDVSEEDVRSLDRTLARGSSVWRATNRGLERRVDRTATAAYEMATGPEDPISKELTEAWSRAYGRNPDPGDAWDHAIKAVEAVLRPIQGPGVVPFWCEMPVWDDLCEYEVMRERGVSACRRDEGARLR